MVRLVGVNTADDGRPVWSVQDVEKLLVLHGPLITHVCREILGNDKDAEDAVADVTAKLLKNPPKEPVKHPKAYLREVAKTTALDLLRKRRRTREVLSERDPDLLDPTAVEALRAFQVRLDAPKFVNRISAMLGESREEDVALCVDALLNRCTLSAQAEKCGLSEREMKNRRRRAVNAVRRAATVVALITDPGDDANPCPVPAHLASQKTDSPELLRDVEAHVRDCRSCQRRCADRNGLRGVVLAVPGAALGGMLLRGLLAGSRSAKVSAAAVVGATAALVATVFLTPVTGPLDPEHALALPPTVETPPAVSGTTSMPPSATPAARKSSPEASSGPATPPSAPSSTTRWTAATSSVPAPDGSAGTGGGARDGSGPAVTDSWVQYRRIAAADDGTCGNRQTSSDIRVTVAPGAMSATILLTVSGRTVSLPMRSAEGGTRWGARVGPLPNDDARASLGVAVEVLGFNKARTMRSLGTIDVCPCRSAR
jgi:RNA polymerase sigma factor (sigma-70 family)